MSRRTMFRITTICGILLTAAFFSGCGPNQNILRSAENKTPAENVSIEKSSMEQDLQAMRNAEFSTVFVLRRNDGGQFDSVDRLVVRENTALANRRVTGDQEKAVIVGSNFPIDPKNLVALRERFQFEDHSPPPPANTNSNANN